MKQKKIVHSLWSGRAGVSKGQKGMGAKSVVFSTLLREVHAAPIAVYYPARAESFPKPIASEKPNTTTANPREPWKTRKTTES